MDLHTFFSEEVKPALGCTEPGAVALAAATAARRLDHEVEKIYLRLSANIFKNGLNVGIPGTGGLKGNLLAAALGVLAGDPDKGLMVLSDISDSDVLKAKAMLEKGMISQEVVDDVPKVYAEVDLSGGGETAMAVVSGRHDRIAEIRRNGTVEQRQIEPGTGGETRPAYMEELLDQDMEGLWELAGTIDGELRDFMHEGAEMNLGMSRRGLSEPWGLGAGYVLGKKGPQDDMLWKIKAWTTAAADVRMGGGPWPVMSSAGSGNHGITAIVPAAVAGEEWGSSRDEIAEALALSHLVTGYIKAHTGRLTPVCGCAVAAGSGAAAALVRLSGGTPAQAGQAVASLQSAVLGMVCDGAKGSCSLKVGAAAGEAWISAILALEGYGVQDRQGVVSPDLRETARNVGVFSSIGLSPADSVIIKILQDKARA